MKHKKNAGQEVQGGGIFSGQEREGERARRGLNLSNSLTVPSASYYLTVHIAYTQIFS